MNARDLCQSLFDFSVGCDYTFQEDRLVLRFSGRVLQDVVGGVPMGVRMGYKSLPSTGRFMPVTMPAGISPVGYAGPTRDFLLPLFRLLDISLIPRYAVLSFHPMPSLLTKGIDLPAASFAGNQEGLGLVAIPLRFTPLCVDDLLVGEDLGYISLQSIS